MKLLIRKIYKAIPFKRFAFEMIRKLGSPPVSVYKHLHFKGDFTVNVDAERSFKIRHYGYEVENALFWEGIGGWEKESISIWKELVKTADVVFDIGANTGVYALVAKAVNPHAKVYAFEPIDRVFTKLQLNVKLNDFDISCEKLAVSNSDGIATVFDTPTEHTYSVTVNKNLNRTDVAVIPTAVNTVRLDSFINNNDLQNVALLKVDVETHEPEVLEGFGEYLAKFRPTMLIEILNDDIGSRVEALVKDSGYLFFNIDDAANSVRRVETIGKSDFYNYLFVNERVARDLGLLTS